MLDQSQPRQKKAYPPALTGTVLMVLAVICFWELSHKTISREQQAELKTLVRQIAEFDAAATPAVCWRSA